ncbi:hypothetical protein H5410_061233 [Solanum commersonii]|uniref:Uncharacterized protein n=1 Tax=Solanum commersonii TaxID=4109 RepID=A0A9J5W753_SOLCO|nr:hypothetical protein H5410_061233 [Solanum commersonii]
MESLADCYPLAENATFLYRNGLAFQETLDDNESTKDEAMDEEDNEDVVDDNANVLMLFDGAMDVVDGQNMSRSVDLKSKSSAI